MTIMICDTGIMRPAVANEIADITALQQAAAAAALSNAQAAQIALLTAAYTAAIAQPVSYTTQGNVTDTYQCDPDSRQELLEMTDAFSAAQATPSGFWWRSATNQNNLFTYADMKALAAVMGAQGWAAFQHFQAQKAAVLAAATVSAVQGVTW